MRVLSWDENAAQMDSSSSPSSSELCLNPPSAVRQNRTRGRGTSIATYRQSFVSQIPSNNPFSLHSIYPYSQNTNANSFGFGICPFFSFYPSLLTGSCFLDRPNLFLRHQKTRLAKAFIRVPRNCELEYRGAEAAGASCFCFCRFCEKLLANFIMVKHSMLACISSS